MRFTVFIFVLILIFSLLGCETAVHYEDAVLVGDFSPTAGDVAIATLSPTVQPTAIITPLNTPELTGTPEVEITLAPTLAPVDLPDSHTGLNEEIDGVTPIPTSTPLPSPTPSSMPALVTVSDLDEYDLGAVKYSGANEQLFYMRNHLGSSKAGVIESVCSLQDVQITSDDKIYVIANVLDYYTGIRAGEKLISEYPDASEEQKKNAQLYG